MIKKMSFFLIICCVFSFLLQGLPGQETAKKEKEWPKIGSVYKYSGVEWFVRGVGKEAFEYTASGESLSLVVDNIPGTIVLVPKKDQIVRCDPGEPMLYVDKKPDPDLSRNSYFKKTAKDKVWLLLELKRK